VGDLLQLVGALWGFVFIWAKEEGVSKSANATEVVDSEGE
jgi:hypothetical protein